MKAYMLGKKPKNKPLKKKPETRQSRMFRDAFRSKQDIRVRKHTEDERHRGLPRWVWVLWVLFLGSMAYAVFFSPFHTLTDMTVYGNRDIPADRIEDRLREEWSRPITGFLPGDNFFLFRTGRMERDLLERFPKLETAEVRKTFPDGVEIVISERNRIPLFCSREKCFLIDADGRARDAGNALLPENGPYLVRIEDASGQEVAEGDAVLDPSLPDTVLRLEREFREGLGFSLRSPIVMPSRVAREFRFRTETGWEIYVSPDILPEKTVGTLRLVLEKELPEERREKLRYIDLRTENRAFYAFEREEQEEEEKSEEVSEGSDDEENEEPKEYDSDGE